MFFYAGGIIIHTSGVSTRTGTKAPISEELSMLTFLNLSLFKDVLGFSLPARLLITNITGPSMEP